MEIKVLEIIISNGDLFFYYIYNIIFFLIYFKIILGIGDWAQSPIPNPQSPIPNPHRLKNLNKK